jgi:hypothetical protein
VGAAYGVGLLVWAFTAAGFGHGSYLPAGLIAAPISSVFQFGSITAPLLWAAIGYAIGRRWAAAGMVLLAVHTASGATSLVRGTPWETPDQQWEQLAYAGRMIPVFVWPGFVVHLVGLVVAFTMVLRQLREES